MDSVLSGVVNSPEALVGLSAFLATFIGSVMADEQNVRLKQGTFGALAGTAVGGFAAVIDNQSNLVLIGIFGSATGAIVGWIVYLGLSVLAVQKWGRRIVDYQVSGLKGMSAKLDLDEENKLRRALTVWSENFRGMVLRETRVILSITDSYHYNEWVKIAIRGWLTSLIDTFNMVLDALAEKSEYEARVTVIIFGSRDGKPEGKHWVSWAGRRQAHKLQMFGEDSVAFKVLSGEKPSPFFEPSDHIGKEGEKRPSGEPSYGSYYVFRLNDRAVLSLDWPGKLEKLDSYVEIAKELLLLDVVPAIGELLDKWSGEIAEEVGLEPWSWKERVDLASAASSVPGSWAVRPLLNGPASGGEAIRH